MKSIGRGAGRSAFAKGMYNSAGKGKDERTGIDHDFTRKAGVSATTLYFSGAESQERIDEFWNRVEQHHRRQDAVVAREVECALPAELSAEQRAILAMSFGKDISEKYGVAVQVNVHAPREADGLNHHAHYLLSACYCAGKGELGKKVVELDPIHCQRQKLENAMDALRPVWAERANHALAMAGHEVRIDHRTLDAQGIDREAQIHMGQSAAALESKGIRTDRGDKNREIEAANAEIRRLRREIQEVNRMEKTPPSDLPHPAPRPIPAQSENAENRLAEQNRRAREADEELRQKRAAEEQRRQAEQEQRRQAEQEQRRQAEQERALRETARRIAQRAHSSTTMSPKPR